MKILFCTNSANRIKSQEHISAIKQANVLLLFHSKIVSGTELFCFVQPHRTQTKSNAAETVQSAASLRVHSF